MMKIKDYIYLFLTVLVPVLTACVHEYPADGGTVPDPKTIITLNLNTEEPFELITRAANNELRYMHYIIEVFKNDYKGQPVWKKDTVVVKNDGGTSQLTLQLPLQAGQYKVAVWTSVAETADDSNSLFILSDLSAITFSGTYIGTIRNKECYDARFDINIPHTLTDSRKTITQKLSTPMAGIEIITTDLEQFKTQETNTSSTEYKDDSWWKDYTITWKYDMYFPTTYNAYTGLPVKVNTNIQFQSDIKIMTDREASVGYDFIFVNGQTANQYISLSLYKGNQLLNTHEALNAPLERGKMTVIKDKFLTTNHQSGPGINPDFDGEINIDR